MFGRKVPPNDREIPIFISRIVKSSLSGPQIRQVRKIIPAILDRVRWLAGIRQAPVEVLVAEQREEFQRMAGWLFAVRRQGLAGAPFLQTRECQGPPAAVQKFCDRTSKPRAILEF